MLRAFSLALLFSFSLASAGTSAQCSDFNGAQWGLAPDAVRTAAGATGWAQDNAAAGAFPKELSVSVYRSGVTIAGYKATVYYYFWANRFFQATVKFNFDDLANYDLNYNVYKCVSDYYETIRGRTLSFVNDCYGLFTEKFGPKEPYFIGLDPRASFYVLDSVFGRESWNLRYHPHDFYRMIRTQSWARWDFPQTSVIFSILISAPDKKFDYSLSYASAALAEKVNAVKDSLRMKGL
jgi:hypothetical protein